MFSVHATAELLNPFLSETHLKILLSNARRFYSLKGDPLGSKALKTQQSLVILNVFEP